MKILIVSPFLPYPLDSGGKTRLYNLLKGLAAAAEIDLLVVHEDPLGEEELERFKKDLPSLKIFAKRIRKSSLRKVGYFLLNWLDLDGLCFLSVKRMIKRIIRKEGVETVQFEFSQAARYLPSGLAIRNFLTIHEIRFKKLAREASLKKGIGKLKILFKFILIQGEELSNFHKFSDLILVSQDDRAFLDAYVNVSKMHVVPNGVDAGLYHPAEEVGGPKKIFFLGWFGNDQNKDALDFLLEDILPRSETGPGLVVIGKDLGEGARLELARRGAEYHSFIPPPETSAFLADCALVVPLRIGGGTRLKILEAMAMGRPVLSTSIGAEGLEVEKEENILLADTAEEFAGQLDRLMKDGNLWQKLSLAGRKLVEEKYSWQKISERQLKIYQ